jgi:tetratricopeptide (TPR) repeat protein
VIIEPAGASILLDGKPPQSSPNTFLHVPFGEHQLTATLDGYVSIERHIAVRKGMDPQVHLQLAPVQEVAALSVVTEPAGASTLLDGNPPQSPPNIFTRVPFGTHDLVATLNKYLPTKQNIDVQQGISEIQVKLKQAPPEEIAWIISLDKGQLEETRKEYVGALQIYRELLEKGRETFRPDVAKTLNNMAVLDSRLGLLKEARQEYAEALQIYRELAEKNQETYRPLVATAVNNLANADLETARLEEARREFEEALQIRRELAEKNPGAYRPFVARTLNNLAILDSRQNKLEKARNEFAEALRIYRNLDQNVPETYRPYMATTLYNLADVDVQQRRFEDARKEYTEALQIYESLAKQDPGQFMPKIKRVEKLLEQLSGN